MSEEQEAPTTPELEDTELDLTNEDIDEELSEKDALAQAKEQGIEFEDFWTREIDGEVKEFDSAEAAKKAVSEDGKKTPIFQNRRQKQPTNEEN